jgi:hypothetical protein
MKIPAFDREIYEARLKAWRDMAALAEEYWLGIEIGEMMGRIRLCQTVLKQAQTPRDELVRMSMQQLSRLAQQLQTQAFPPQGDTNVLPALDVPPIPPAPEALHSKTKVEADVEPCQNKVEGLQDVGPGRAVARDDFLTLGNHVRMIRACQILLQLPQTPYDELKKLPLEELGRLAEELNQRWLHPTP